MTPPSRPDRVTGAGPVPPDDVAVTDSAAVSAADDTAMMDLALAAARGAGQAGEVPVGAVVADRSGVLAVAANRREELRDPTAHAEVLALREAAQALSSWRLSGATLYVTLEPCPMCAGALLAARVGRLVFGATDPKAGSCGSLYNLCADPRLNHELPVTAGVRAAECSEILSAWFTGRRADRSGAPAGGL